MLKVVNAPHVFDRKHKYVLKLKPEDDETGTIVECHPGEGMHAAASAHDKSKVKELGDDWMTDSRCSGVDDDGSYFNMCFEEEDVAAAFVASAKETVRDNVDHRISRHREPTIVSYRYGPRLGYFVVDWKGEQIRVGGGLRYKAGNDDRMDFWQRREELVGQPIDFRMQKDKENVAKARFNKFVRIREDLSIQETEQGD